jgi:peptide/nickel transport system permease protein
VLKYILGRVALLVPVLLGVSVITFLLLRLIPGDAVLVALGADSRATPEQIAAIRKAYGLDQPLPVQYAHWLGRAVRGDLGKSLRSGRTLREELALRLPVTAELTLLAAIVGTVPALIFGTLAAIRRGSAFDFAATVSTLIGISIPNFLLAALMVLVFSLWLRWLPPLGYSEFFKGPGENLKKMVLPALTLGLPLTAILMRITRSSVLEVLGQEHVRVARAKGLPEWRVIARHVLPNSAIPIITFAGIQIARLLGGTVIVESIFGLPGIGRYIFEAIGTRDYPVVQGVTLIIAVIFVVTSLVVDILYAVIDPRLRTS